MFLGGNMKKFFYLASALASFVLFSFSMGYAGGPPPEGGVPEPSTIAVLVGLGLGAILARKALKRK